MLNVKAQLMERDAIFVQSLHVANYLKCNAIDLFHVRSLYRSFSSGLNNIHNRISCIGRIISCVLYGCFFEISYSCFIQGHMDPVLSIVYNLPFI